VRPFSCQSRLVDRWNGQQRSACNKSAYSSVVAVIIVIIVVSIFVAVITSLFNFTPCFQLLYLE
jgi:hypothetical protein